MRKIVVSQFLTLDGIMEAPEVWNKNYLSDVEVANDILGGLRESDMLWFGKTTYEFFAARWPFRTGLIADYINRLPKLVVSSTLQNAEWNNTVIVEASAIDEMSRLKEQPGRNMLVLGSYQLVKELMKEELVDEYKLYIYPLTLGGGKRLFETDAPAMSMKPVTAKQSASGVIIATYRAEINHQ